MPGVTLSSQSDSCLHERLLLTRSSLEAHRNASSRSVEHRHSSSLPQHLEGDLGLWQAVQQELFPKPVKTRHTEPSSREDNQGPPSPGMLSVVTAPSDGGTTRGHRMCTRSSVRTQPYHVDTLSQMPVAAALQHARCGCCTGSQDKSDDLSTPVSSICGDGTHTDVAAIGDSAALRNVRSAAGQGNGIPVHKAVTPIPECNSSLETAGSTGFNASHGTTQLQSGRLCGSAFTSSSEGPMLMPFSKPTETCAVEDAADFVQHLTDGSSTQISGSCSSESPRCDRRRQRKRDSTPPVQYGFPASPQHPSASNSPRRARGCGAAAQENPSDGRPGSDHYLFDTEDTKARKRNPGVVPRPATGLLSASLSQANSAGTSPHAAGVGPVVKRPYGWPQARPVPRVGTCSAPLNSFACSPLEAKGSEARSVPASGQASDSDVLGSSAIPPALIAEMACMGFHRPLKVGSKTDLSSE